MTDFECEHTSEFLFTGECGLCGEITCMHDDVIENDVCGDCGEFLND